MSKIKQKSQSAKPCKNIAPTIKRFMWNGTNSLPWTYTKVTNTIDHSTTQRKLRPFLGVWQATRKDDAAECKSTLDLLPEDLSLSCFGEGKLTQRSKRQGYRFLFLFLCDAVFLVSFLPCRTPPPDHVHESLPDHFRPCPQNTWAPYYTAARDWLKPKGVSALTDRSGVVYSLEPEVCTDSPQLLWMTA